MRSSFQLLLGALVSGALLVPQAFSSRLPVQAAPTAKATQGIQWVPYDQALTQAKAQKRPIYLQFHATWCPYCKKLEKEAYSKAPIQKLLNEQFIPVRITEGSSETFTVAGKKLTVKDLFMKYQVSSFPTLVFLSAEGKPLGKTPGYVEPKPFEALLGFVSSESYKTMDFETYFKGKQ